MIDRRKVLGFIAAAPATEWLSVRPSFAAETAADYPSRSVEIIIPYAAGAAPDAIARALKAELEPKWRQPVVVDYRPGSNGIIACEMIAHAAPDGYNLVMGSLATHAINFSAYKKLPFNPITDFAPVTEVAQTPFIITSHPSVPAKTLPELIAYAKANPGKLTFASTGLGSLGHLAGIMFQMYTGTKMVHVPYSGISQGVTDELSGVVNLAFSTVLNVLPFIKSGQLRAYGVTSMERIAVLPDVPPVSSVIPGYEAIMWYAWFAPAKTPAAIVDKISADANRILHETKNRQIWAEQAVVLTGTTPEQLSTTLKADIEKWAKVVKAAGLSL